MPMYVEWDSKGKNQVPAEPEEATDTSTDTSGDNSGDGQEPKKVVKKETRPKLRNRKAVKA